MPAASPIFCLASGRSGTHFLYEVLRRNTVGTICRHEPYLFNPSMFGRAIYDRTTDDVTALRQLAERKRRVIDSYLRGATYIETSHALLKSWSDLAIEYFPQMKLIHLVRNPLFVAKSEATREAIAHRWQLPFRNYRGADGMSYFRWALTGREPIFTRIQQGPLNRFQWYVVQWIEIENRAMAFLKQYAKLEDTFTLHSPTDLNDRALLQQLFQFLELAIPSQPLSLSGRRNRTPGVRLEITEQDRRDFADVLSRVPGHYLAVFSNPPYCQWDWATQLLAPPRLAT